MTKVWRLQENRKAAMLVQFYNHRSLRASDKQTNIFGKVVGMTCTTGESQIVTQK